MTPSHRPAPFLLAALCLAVLVAVGLLPSGPARAQNLFAPVILVMTAPSPATSFSSARAC